VSAVTEMLSTVNDMPTVTEMLSTVTDMLCLLSLKCCVCCH